MVSEPVLAESRRSTRPGVGKNSIGGSIATKLWPHQREAIKTIEQYLGAGAVGSALIRMPTGTGKTGIITIVSQYTQAGSVLVVVPWVVLRKQISREIRNDFWRRIGRPPRELQKKVVQFTPSSIESVLEESRGKDFVFVCNVQSLERIHSSQEVNYTNLRKRVRLVLFDEGHREPAPEWAKAIRSLGVPTVLLTATPYRNDHKMFNVNPNFVYAYPYSKAVKQRYVRDVKFHEDKWEGPKEFVNSLLRFYRGEFLLTRPSVEKPRVIVRCESGDEVNAVASLLKSEGVEVLAVHDTFKEEDFRRKTVPSPPESDAVFWVHQNKLIEGIDDPSFCLLAIYQPFTNARALVQQIGRVTRNPNRLRDQFASVFTNSSDHQKDFWENYREYELNYDKDPDLYERKSMYDLSIRIQPKYRYFEGNFREIFDIDSKEIHKYFRYPLSTNCFSVDGKLTLDNLREAVENEWSKSDLEIRNVTLPEKDTIFFAYVTYENSPVLLDASYVEFKLGFTICRKVRDYIFFYDSNGMMCDYLAKSTGRIEPGVLQGLFSGKSARATELSLLNSDPGAHSIRRRTIYANSISDIAPYLGDFYYFPSTTRGFANSGNEIVRRYVGYSRGRVSDASREDIGYKDYMKWLGRLAVALDARPRALSLFNRYARFIDPPKDTTPVSILLDIGEISEYFESGREVNGKRQPLVADDLYCAVVDGHFDLTANSISHAVEVGYEPERKRYKLRSRDFDSRYVRKGTAPEEVGESVVGYLNREQLFRIVVGTPGVIYAHSHFYKPTLPIAGEISEGFDLLRIFKPIDRLGQIGTEKGRETLPRGRGWQEDSLFALIDHLGEDTELGSDMKDVNLLVCDDLLSESADFIAASEESNEVMFIHAKASSTPRIVSASSLQTVFEQVKKNLAYLHPMTSLRPPNLERWSGSWVSNIGTVNDRIRRGNGAPDQIWSRILSIIRDPSAKREVWVVLGQEFSFAGFDEERRKANPSPEVVQVLFQLLSLWQAVSEVGATLRIYCSP